MQILIFLPDGTIVSGDYTTIEGTIRVTYAGRSKTSEIGDEPPRTVARRLLRKLVAEVG